MVVEKGADGADVAMPQLLVSDMPFLVPQTAVYFMILSRRRLVPCESAVTPVSFPS
jgi:hypothetical protein